MLSGKLLCKVGSVIERKKYNIFLLNLLLFVRSVHDFCSEDRCPGRCKKGCTKLESCPTGEICRFWAPFFDFGLPKKLSDGYLFFHFLI